MNADDRAAHLYVLGKIATHFLAFCCGVDFYLIVGAV